MVDSTMASSNSSTTGGGGAASGGSNVASSSDSSGSVQQPYKVWYDPEQPPTPFKSRCQQQLDVVLAHPKLKAMLERIARVQQVCGLSRSLALSCATQANGLLYKQSRGSPGMPLPLDFMCTRVHPLCTCVAARLSTPGS